MMYFQSPPQAMPRSREKMRQVLVLIVLFAGLLYCAYGAWRAMQFNQQVSIGDLQQAKLWAPELHKNLIEAMGLEQSGDLAQASEHYAALRASESAELWSVARFNLAGVYLMQAVALEREEKQDGRAVLIELAKLHYRALLQADENDHQAAHQLAVALALQPDVIAPAAPELDEMPERSPQAPVTASGRERLP